MVISRSGLNGVFAIKHVVMDSKRGQGRVQTLRPNMVVSPVKGIIQK